MSGKNSADIRMVVDALDLCYTKSHVDTFVIVSGDSDFSPLVSKLRENAKTVIGIGVKKSTSDLLIANCDEFIYYDDLVREQSPSASPRARAEGKAEGKGEGKAAGAGEGQGEGRRTATPAARGKKQEASTSCSRRSTTWWTSAALEETLWGSMVKQAIKRRKPGFSESYYGYRSFNQLLEELQDKGLLDLERDDKSGGYTIRSVAPDE